MNALYRIIAVLGTVKTGQINIKSIEVRKALTDERDNSGVEQGKEYAALTNLMSRKWRGMSISEYKQHKC